MNQKSQNVDINQGAIYQLSINFFCYIVDPYQGLNQPLAILTTEWERLIKLWQLLPIWVDCNSTCADSVKLLKKAAAG